VAHINNAGTPVYKGGTQSLNDVYLPESSTCVPDSIDKSKKEIMPVASNIYYFTYQKGEIETLPVVLIHGAGGSHLYWPSEIRRLQGFRIFAPDLPGHGKSAGRGQQSIETYAKIITDWLESLGLRRAAFIGHSMGAGIALELALRYPEHVIGLGLIGAGARLRVSPEILADAASPTTFHRAVEIITGASFSQFAEARLVELAATRMAETRPAVFYGDFLACDQFDVNGEIQQIHQPVLVVCGAEDRLTPLRYSEFLSKQIPNAQLEVIPQAGHMVMLEQPDTVAAMLSRFLGNLAYHAGENS
jgi:pimeloyl-ACP methyl ester carboxylesterase